MIRSSPPRPTAARLRIALPGPDGVLLGLMVADLVLAARLGWANPVPLLATALAQPALRARLDHSRASVSAPDWIAVCQAGYAAALAETYARAVDLALLADDVVAASHIAGLGSERAARRFLDRLATLGVVREQTGRTTFRLYGL